MVQAGQQANAGNLPTTTTLRSRRGQVSLEKEIKNSSDAESDVLAMEPSSSSRSTVKILKEVAIPIKKSSEHEAPQSPSSSSSVISSRQDYSIGYDTPGTSAAVTPAEFIAERSKSKSLFGGTNMKTLNGAMRMSAETPSSVLSKGKRKRGSEDELRDLMDSDARLAHALQAEEYAEAEPRAKKGRKLKIEDSEQEAESLSDVPTDFDIESISRSTSMQADRQKVKAIKTGSRLPTRAARDNARKSIADKASLGILDDDDNDAMNDSELSDYLSDMDSEAVDNSDYDDEGVLNPTDIGIAAAVTGAPSTLPNAGRRRRRQLPMASAQAAQTMPGRPNQWTSRVSTFPSCMCLVTY